ncbi:MAG: nucleotide-binding protein [Verrucomicrobiota bacterium]|nr:nucleotide-binding protein [Verrucomicrobiota bacterium]
MIIPNPRPSIFIGSSTEGLPIAEAIQLGLDHDCQVTIWSQGVFGLSRGTLETLAEAVNRFDYAILVLTPDDLTLSRDQISPSPRDNVLGRLNTSGVRKVLGGIGLNG